MLLSFVFELYLIFRVVVKPRLFSFIGKSEYIFIISCFEDYFLLLISLILIDEFNGICGVNGFATCYVKIISRLLAYDGVHGFYFSVVFFIGSTTSDLFLLKNYKFVELFDTLPYFLSVF